MSVYLLMLIESIETGAPMTVADASKRRFVFLAATGFDSLLSGRTRRLAEVLAARGHHVSFVELPTVRTALTPPRRFGVRAAGDTAVRIVRPWPLPGYVRLGKTGLARRWADRTARALGRWIPDLDRSVVVASTPRWWPVVQRLPRAIMCYDYIDHIQVQAGPRGAGIFLDWDAALLETCDLATTVSEALRGHLADRLDAARVFMVPNGVPGEWVSSPPEALGRDTLTPGSDRVIAGFLGTLYEWIDVDLLVSTARALPHVEFVLVGPTRRGVRLDALRTMANVRCLGSVPFANVPATIASFDVCLIPFHRDAIAECADPLKVYEYCALGKPVVSTVGFGAGDGGAPIVVAGDPDDFAAAIERAASEDSAEQRAARVAYADGHTWERRARDFAAAVERVLDPSSGPA